MGQAGIDEASLQRLVRAFYARVRQDALIGPVFEGSIDDWPHHLNKLQAFWSSVMLGSGRYKGQPLLAHIRHTNEITPATFERWLMIWRATTEELLAPAAAAAMQERAARIAESLALGIEFQRDRSALLRPLRNSANPEDGKTA